MNKNSRKKKKNYIKTNLTIAWLFSIAKAAQSKDWASKTMKKKKRDQSTIQSIVKEKSFVNLEKLLKKVKEKIKK